MQFQKITCELCGELITKNQMPKHLRRHEKHPETFKPSYNLTHEDLHCCFCAKLCKNKNSLVQHELRCKLNPERIQSTIIRNFNQEGTRTAWNKGLTKETDSRVHAQSKSLSAFYEKHEGSFTGRTHTEETKNKIGAGVKEFLLKNPDMIPYKRNHSSNESYPEEYFTKLFEEEGIHLVKQFAVHSYRLDFCNPDKKVDIEVDGDQHYLDKRIVEHDKVRNKFLEDNGWIVFRIRWSTYKKMDLTDKQKVIQQIKDLLK